MRIRVEFISQLREVARCNQTVVDVEKGSNLLDLIEDLANDYGARFEDRVFMIGTEKAFVEDLSVLLNGKVLSRDKASSTELKENDTVVLMPEVII